MKKPGKKEMTLANPKIWGPGTWTLFHCMSATYPKDPSDADKRVYARFFLDMSKVLPCAHCREHSRDFLKKNPIRNVLSNRSSFQLWVIDFHNSVNEKLGKPTVSCGQAMKMIRSKCRDQK